MRCIQLQKMRSLGTHYLQSLVVFEPNINLDKINTIIKKYAHIKTLKPAPI